jgi:hypothetical protein
VRPLSAKVSEKMSKISKVWLKNRYEIENTRSENIAICIRLNISGNSRKVSELYRFKNLMFIKVKGTNINQNVPKRSDSDR